MKTWQLNEELKEYYSICSDMIDDNDEAALFMISTIVAAFDELASDEKLSFEEFRDFVQREVSEAKRARSAA